MSNPFDQLVKDLDDGTLTYLHIQIAYRTHLRHSKVIPENIKNLLSVAGGGGLAGEVFQLLAQIISKVELAYRRGEAAGAEYQKQQELKSVSKKGKE